MIKNIVLLASIFILLLFGNTILSEYWANHGYYSNMLFGGWENWKLLFAGLFVSLIFVLFLVFKKNKTIVGFSISLFLTLFLFGILYFSIKDTILGSGARMWFINTLFFLVLILYFFYGILSFGIFLKQEIAKLQDVSIYDYFVSFGLGLISFLFVLYIMILTNSFYSILNWILFGILGLFIYFKREKIKDFNDKIFVVFESLNPNKDKYRVIKYIGMILFLFSVVYFLYGFIQAYIPYPTAWDANHAYMFYPKMWAYNNGFYWNEQNMRTTPYLWTPYISYWFSLFIPLENSLWISPDTVAIVMNFLSGVFVLIFSLLLFKEIVDIVSKYISKSNEKIDDSLDSSVFKSIVFYIGWFCIILWLTSGMGAFLVFVDNKTDLGVMAITILAIYSGFEFIKKIIFNENELLNNDNGSIYTLIIISGILFAGAVLAKQTAFIDVVNFSMFLSFLWIGVLCILGLFLMIIGVLAFIKFRGINEYIGENSGITTIFSGLISFVLGLFENSFVNKFFNKKQDNKILPQNYFEIQKKLISYILVWGLTIVSVLALVKGPYIIYNSIKASQKLDVQTFFRRLLLSKSNFGVTKVYAEEIAGAGVSIGTGEQNVISGTQSILSGDNQSITGNQIQISTDSNSLSLNINSCNQGAVGVSENKELYKNLKQAPGDAYSEDVGRYVGYGRKTFQSSMLSFLFPSDNSCYFGPKDAKILCENEQAIENFDTKKLQEILYLLPTDSKGYTILSGILNSEYVKGVDLSNDNNKKIVLENLTDQLKELRSYHKDYTIKISKTCTISKKNTSFNSQSENCDVYESDKLNDTEVIYDKDISIPYKLLIPFNITFNRSLQNVSSYYTDIGFIWLIMLIFVLIGFVYGIVKLNKLLIGITGATLLGWTIWFFIGGGILWYGIGLVVWTIMSFIVFLYYIYDHEKPLYQNALWFVFVIIFMCFGVAQLAMNLVRIGSQGGSGPFLWYKQGVGKDQLINEKFDTEDVLKVKYGWKDVFNLQFSHYNKFIDAMNSRKPSEGAFLAGTYSRYFIKKQDGIIYDQFLIWLWNQFSDNDVCKSFLRLKDKNIRYIAIDPNIGTVVMGGGNMSLFDRFFAKINTVSGNLEEDGVMTMLAKLVSGGYVTLMSTNNIGAKYGYSLTNEELKTYAGGKFTNEELVMLRARMATARYWQNENMNKLIQNIAQDRMLRGYFLGDYADIAGKSIDENKLMKFTNDFVSAKDPNQRSQVLQGIKDLTQDERNVFGSYLSLLTMMQSSPKQFEAQITNLLKQSNNASSQIIFFRVNW